MKLLKLGKTLYFLKNSKCAYKEPKLENKFDKTKLKASYDNIIIGSGPSGLMCASILSKLGKSCLLLEQHNKLGGGLHTFTVKGFQFDVGYQVLANAALFHKFLQFGLSKPVEFNVFKDFELVQLSNMKKFLQSAPMSNFITSLKQEYPEDSSKIDQLEKLFVQCDRVFKLLAFNQLFSPQSLKAPIQNLLIKLNKNITGHTFLSKMQQLGLGNNTSLQSILFGNWNIYGIPISDAPLHLLAYIGYFAKGGYIYPKGGPAEITKSLLGSFETNNGQAFTSAMVKNILVENNKAIGIQLKDGTKILANNIISAMGYHNTLDALPEKSRWNVKYKSHRHTVSQAMLFVGIDAEGLNLPVYNTSYFPCKSDCNVEKLLQCYYETQDYTKMPVQITFGGRGGNKEKFTQVIVKVPFKTDWVMKYRQSQSERQGDYQKYKDNLQNYLHNVLLQLHPELKNRIKLEILGTPLTFEKSLNRYGVIGMEYNKERAFDIEHSLKFDTPVQGLYLSGQDTIAPGIFSSVLSGVFTSLKVEHLL